MPGECNRSKRPSAPEVSEALVAGTVTVVMRIVRDRQATESAASAQAARLVHAVLASLAEKEGKHDTLLRIPDARFAIWANRVREGMRRHGRSKRQ